MFLFSQISEDKSPIIIVLVYTHGAGRNELGPQLTRCVLGEKLVGTKVILFSKSKACYGIALLFTVQEDTMQTVKTLISMTFK
jgi:hypothetical protein